MKTILIPIDASKEKPSEKNKQISISVRRVPDFKEVEYDFHYKEWFEKSSSHYQVIVKYWYKEVTIDELLPNEKIPNDELETISDRIAEFAYAEGYNDAIDYIKQKLES